MSEARPCLSTKPITAVDVTDRRGVSRDLLCVELYPWILLDATLGYQCRVGHQYGVSYQYRSVIVPKRNFGKVNMPSRFVGRLGREWCCSERAVSYSGVTRSSCVEPHKLEKLRNIEREIAGVGILAGVVCNRQMHDAGRAVLPTGPRRLKQVFDASCDGHDYREMCK